MPELSDEALLAGEALVVLFTFGNALAYLIAPHLGPVTVELGEVDEVLTEPLKK